MKIKHSILIVLFALGILPLIMFGVYTIKTNGDKISKMMEENLRETSAIQIKSMNDFFEQRNKNLDILSTIDLVEDLIKSGQHKNALSGIHRYVDDLLVKNMNLYTEGIFIVDENYNVISSTEPLTDEIKNFLKSKDENQENKEFYISNLIPSGRYGNKKKMLIVEKAIRYDGILKGYVVEFLNLKFFDSIRDSVKIQENGTIYLLDSNNNLVMAGNSTFSIEEFVLNIAERGDFLKKWRVLDIGVQPEGSLRYKAKGNNYITYYSMNQKNNWKLFVSTNLDQLLQQNSSYLFMICIVLFTMVAILIVSNMLATHKIMRPVEQIIKTLNEIVEKRNYDLRLPDISKNEMGRISVGVNSLLTYIQENIDIEEQKKQKLREKADRDPLTWLLNKQKLEQVFKEELERTREKKGRLAFVFVDIDKFKDFNTNYGHLGGDKILKFIAQVLNDCTSGHKGRIGGDEFILCIYEEEEVGYVVDIALQIIGSLNSGYWMEERNEWVEIGCSIGISYYPESGRTYEELLKGSDDAMYKVKAKGKNSYAVVRVDEFGKKIYE